MEKTYSVMYLDQDGVECEEVYLSYMFARDVAKQRSCEYGVATLEGNGYIATYAEGNFIKLMPED